jgi:16S rRNA processing protein RimM
MTYQDDDFILVGNFGRPIGLKGSIKLNSFTRPPENIKSYNSFFMKEKSEFIELEVKKISTSSKNLVIFLNNCNSLDEAEKTFKGRKIFIPKLDLPETKDKFYWSDLIGLEVVIRSSEKTLGKVHSLMETGSNDVLIIKNPNQEDILIPFIMKQVILEVTEKSIYVDWEV